MIERPSAVWRFVRRNTAAVVGGSLVLVFVLAGMLAPVLSPRHPNAINLRETLAPPGVRHLLGTDNQGRDLLSRVLHGARMSLVISLSAVGGAAVAGVTLGLLAGYYRRLDMPTMRLMDVLLAFPGIVVALTIISILGTGVPNMVVGIAIYQVPQFARLIRGTVLAVREQAYVEAARATGASDALIIVRHILSNTLAPITVQASLLIPGAIMTSAGLSFLGLGVPPPTAEWGSMLQNSLQWSSLAPHVMIIPGLALMLVVFGFNLLGDGLRDALDPRLRRR